MTDHWENGMCDHVCGGSCGTCMASWCCAPCLYGRTSQRLSMFPDTDKDHFSHCNSGCWIFCLAGCFSMHWLVALLKRGELRDRFGIQGDGCRDCLAACFCTPCMLAQMETEVKDRAIKAGSGGMRDIKQGQYAPPAQQGGMVYGQQQPVHQQSSQPYYQDPQVKPQQQY